MLRCFALLIICLPACKPSLEEKQARAASWHDSVKAWCDAMGVTPVQAQCGRHRGHSVYDNWGTQCDVHTREVGMVALVCSDGVCRLGSI